MSNQVEIEAAKEWFMKNKSKVDDDEQISKVSFGIFARHALALGHNINSRRSEYTDADLAGKRRIFYSVPGTGLKPPVVEVPEDEEEEEEEEDEEEEDEEVSLASALTYSLGTGVDDAEVSEFIAHISTKYSDREFGLLRRLCGVVHKKTQDIPAELKLGKPHPISLAQYGTWKRNLEGNASVVGPYQLWNILERLGVTCTSQLSRVPGKEYLQYERNGIKLNLYDRFMVHTNYATDTEATNDEVNTFCKNLKFKGKDITYKRIPLEGYRMAFAFLSVFRVNLRKDESATCAIIGGGAKVTLPNFDDCISNVVENIRVAFQEGKIRGNSHQEIFENIASYAAKKITGSSATAFAEGIDIATEDVYDTIRKYMVAFKSVSGNTRQMKGRLLEQKFAAKGKAEEACAALKTARDVRNATPCNEMVNHGVGSLRGHNLPEWFDTYIKGQQMVTWATERAEVTKDTKITVYGVAYGHMVPLFTALRIQGANKSNLQFFDNKKATNSTETFINTTVHEHNREGSWVFDDTDSHNLPTGSPYDAKVTSGDHLKVSRFFETRSPVVISKVKLANFRTREHMVAWEQLLAKHDYDVELVKFGRLHNDECFLVATATRQTTSIGTLRADIYSVSLCVEVANAIITKFQLNGLRAGCRRPSDDLKRDCPTLGEIWRGLVSALPVNWSWYADEVMSIDFKSSVVMKEEERMEGMKFDDDAEDVLFPDAWTPTGNPEMVVEPHHQKPKMTHIIYEHGFIYACDGSPLGYGATDDLENKIRGREVTCVKWDNPSMMWQPYTPPKTKKPKKETSTSKAPVASPAEPKSTVVPPKTAVSRTRGPANKGKK